MRYRRAIVTSRPYIRIRSRRNLHAEASPRTEKKMQTKSKTHSSSGKRILSVTIKRMLDDSPDTSYLGEYSNSPLSEFSIDRAHSEDCASVSLEAKNAQTMLEHAQQTVGDIQTTVDYDVDETEWEALETAYTELGQLASEITDCDCGERGDMGRHEYRYFNPSFNYVDKHGKLAEGNTAEDVRKYVRQDYERMESLNRGDWSYIGIRAEAKIWIESKQAGPVSYGHVGQFQTITSSGVWGYESDMSGTDFEEAEEEQLSELRAQLKALGFSARAISVAFKTIERKDA